MTQQLNFFDQPAEALPDFAAPPKPRPVDPEWLALCNRQPLLLEVEKEAASGIEPGYLVPKLEMLAGWYCGDPVLKNRKAFDTAFAALNQAHIRRRAAAAEAMEVRRR